MNTGSKKDRLWKIGFSLLLVFLNRVVVTVASYRSAGPRSLSGLFTADGFQKAVYDNFARLDAGWYAKIAQMGYPDEKTTAFFPFYPLLMKGFSALTGLSYKAAGQLLSTVFFVGCLYLIQILSEKPRVLRFERVKARQAGQWLACIVAFSPLSFFYTIPYTESLFLMLTLAFMVFIQDKRWLAAGFTGLLAGITRNSGVLLGIIFVLEYFRSVLPECTETGFFKRCQENLKTFLYWIRTNPKALFHRSFFSVLLIPSGIIGYFIYLYSKFGNFSAPFKSQTFFGRSTFFPWVTLINGISFNLDKIFHSVKQNIVYYNLLELFYVLFFLYAAFYLIRKVPLSYNLFMIASLILPLIKPVYGSYIDYFGSFPRYTITLFPYFAAFYGPIRKSRTAFILFLAASIYILIVSVTYFCTDFFVA